MRTESLTARTSPGSPRTSGRAATTPMVSGRVVCGLAGVAVLMVSLADAQTPTQPDQQALNPTQEIAKETPEAAALVAGPTEIRIGGYLGLVTAVLAWYGSMAGVLNETAKHTVLPVFPRG